MKCVQVVGRPAKGAEAPALSQQPREKTGGPRAPRQPATKPILHPLAIYTEAGAGGSLCASFASRFPRDPG